MSRFLNIASLRNQNWSVKFKHFLFEANKVGRADDPPDYADSEIKESIVIYNHTSSASILLLLN